MLAIMRHGLTEWNKEWRLQGRSDISLNDAGRRMAREAKEKYKDVRFDVCYCSPLIRARETAELFLEGTDTPIIPDERLTEMCFGDYEGKCRQAEDPTSLVYQLFKDPANFIARDGVESFDELYRRTGEFLREVVEPDLKAGKDVLIVAHGALNLSIINQIENVPLSEFWDRIQENCELMWLRVEKG